MDLTKRQQEIFDFIKRYSAKYGYPPTVRDIGKAVGPGVLVDGARASGQPREGRPAAARPVQAARDRAARPRGVDGGQVAWCAGGLPLVGQVAAGSPMLAEENIEEYIEVPEAGRRRGRRVHPARPGDSMKDAGILEGDFVVVRPQDTARDGEIVVALVGEEATVKRFFSESDHIRLQPENDALEPIRSKDVRVLGRSSECCGE